MGEVYDVAITVASQKGICHAGHKVGDRWILGLNTPEGICASAFIAIYPYAKALRHGGTFPWAEADGSIPVACPDADNPLVFRLRPVGK